MKHIAFVNTKVPTVPDEWLAPSAAASQWVGKLTGHSEVAVKLGPGLAKESGTAQYSPKLGIIEADTDVMAPGVSPDDVLFHNPLFRERNPLLIGALMHEASHVVFSTWVPADLTDKRLTNPVIMQILITLEESRIEKLMIDQAGAVARRFLPSLVWDLLLREIGTATNPYDASLAAALILGRAEAGVISRKAAEPFYDVLLGLLSESQIEGLMDLAVEYHALPFEGVDANDLSDDLYSIAERWMLLLGAVKVPVMGDGGGETAEDKPSAGEAGKGAETPAEGAEGAAEGSDEGSDPSEGSGASEGSEDASEGEDASEDGSEGAEGADEAPEGGSDESDGSAGGSALAGGDEDGDEDGDSDGEGASAGTEPGLVGHGAGSESEDWQMPERPEGEPEVDLGDALREAAAEAKGDAALKHVEKVGNIKREIREAERATEAGRRQKGAEAAAEAFVKHGMRNDAPETGEPGDYHDVEGTRSSVRWRKPTNAERAAAAIFGRKLDRIMVQDRQITKVAQAAPAGRLKTRAAVQRVAEKRAGKLVSEQRPWVVKRRDMTDKPKLRVGVLLDVSGSMRMEAAVCAPLSYIIGNAVTRQDGMFAEVLFGNGVAGVTKPGVKMDAVAEIQPHDGTEHFRKGWAALDSVLDLVNGDGLRVLFLMSDGMFVNEHDKAEADVVLPWLVKQGVVVIHVDANGNVHKQRHTPYNPMHNMPHLPFRLPAGITPEKAAELLADHLLDVIKRTGATANVH